MQNLIFLDIDGVLNSHEWCDQNPFSLGYDGWKSQLSPPLIAILNDIVRATKAAVVLSSTWRFSWTAEELTGLLKDQGATFELLGNTPPATRGRADAMYSWLFLNQGDWNWLALDDSDELLELGERWVNIPDGLVPSDVVRVSKRFSETLELEPVFR